MFTIQYIPYLLILFDLLRRVKGFLEKRKIKKEIGELIKEDVKALFHNLEKIINILSLCIGLTLFLPPQEYSRRLNELMKEFKLAYKETIGHLVKILLVFKARKDTIRSLVSLEDWYYIEPWLNSVSEETINWKFLFKSKYHQEILGKPLAVDAKALTENFRILGAVLEKAYIDLGLRPVYELIYGAYESKEIERKLRMFFEKLEKCIRKSAKEL